MKLTVELPSTKLLNGYTQVSLAGKTWSGKTKADIEEAFAKGVSDLVTAEHSSGAVYRHPDNRLIVLRPRADGWEYSFEGRGGGITATLVQARKDIESFGAIRLFEF